MTSLPAHRRTLSYFFATWVVALASVLSFPSHAVAARPGPVEASIAQTATLVEGGAAVTVSVAVRCAGGSDVLEAFVYVTQDGDQSAFTPIQIRCGGKARTYVVRVPAPEGVAFHTGAASASGFVLVDKKGDVTSASPATTFAVT